MTTPLREGLDALARTQTFSPDPSAWDRGRRARRRTRIAAGVAVLVVLAGLGGGAALWTTADREAHTAATTDVEVPGGAIPSRIVDPGELELEEDLDVGPASVAFFSSTAQAVVIGASDGSYHALDLPDLSTDRGPLSLSPDGRLLAWRNLGRTHVADLTDGTTAFYPANEERADVTALQWVPGSRQLLWHGTDRGGRRSGGVLPVDGGGDPLFPSALRGIPSPTGDLVAVASDGTVDAAPFVRGRGGPIDRELPSDLYPDGASVTPLGWAADHLVVAQVFGPPGSYVEGQHLALFTSPDRPESEWTYRVVARDVPQDGLPLSVAVDLVPDLDGTSSQQLTHDFDVPGDQRDISWLIGLGVAAAIGVLLGLRWLWRRFGRRLMPR
jgi:hypothetical protein